VRVLAKGELTSEGLSISVTGASRAAVEAVGAKGGTLATARPAETAEA
jgi:large subunit ribosomal protein L15